MDYYSNVHVAYVDIVQVILGLNVIEMLMSELLLFTLTFQQTNFLGI